MAPAQAAGLYEDPLWWIEPVIFAFFLVVSILFELALHALEHRLKHKGRNGLLAFVQGLKTEVLLFGLLSLLLSEIQPYLSMICVTVSDASATEGAHAPSNGTEGYHDAAAANTTMAEHGRRLLAESAPSTCKDGKVQLIPYETAHKIHVLIFMIAVSHIFMALLSLGLCLLKVSQLSAVGN